MAAASRTEDMTAQVQPKKAPEKQKVRSLMQEELLLC